MDKRVILYIALGMVLFGLWSAWQKDYAPAANTPNSVIQSSSTNSQIAPTASSASNIVSSSADLSANIPADTKIPAARLIQVKTDVLEVAIDTLGGNIVQAKLLKYPKEIHGTEPVQLFSDDPKDLYIAESGLVSPTGPDRQNQQTIFTAPKKLYVLEPGQNEVVVKLKWNNSKGLSVTKDITFTRDKYNILIDYQIENKTNTDWKGEFFAEIKRKVTEEKGGLFHVNTYTGASISSKDTPYQKLTLSDMQKQNLRQSIHGGWLAMQQRYFLSSWIPNQGKTYNYFSNYSDGTYTLGLTEDYVNVPVGGKVKTVANLYVGPEIAENLKVLAPSLERTVDYGWLWLISEGLFWIMRMIYAFVGNWGWTIVLVTILIKLVFFKLSEASCRQMARMKDLAPKIKALKERYGDDRQKLSQATMELYKKEKINPLGGCLPMLVQIPFFIALYYVLIEAVELRHAPFIFWIHDLSVKDPYYILPVLMGISMFFQQKLTPTSPDPTQAKMMMFMPVIFTVFFMSFPSGLVLYWLVNYLLSILQQLYINQKLAHAPIRQRRSKKT